MKYAVEVDGLSYCYPDSTIALRNIRFAAEEGQKIALIGPSGSGKSTLLRAIAGYIRGSGSIKINGLPLSSQNLRQIRSVMGCYMGNPEDHLSMPTLYENIIFGPLMMNQDVLMVRESVDFILGKMGLGTLIKKSPHSLSDGQKRTAAIASVLSMFPKIILLDEPCSGLDYRGFNNMAEVFKELEQCVVFSTCVMQFVARVADRIIVLYDGRIIADGRPTDILKDEKLLVSHGLE